MSREREPQVPGPGPPAPPLLGGLSKVLSGPSWYAREVSLPFPVSSCPTLLRPPARPRLQRSGGAGVPLAAGLRRWWAGAFSTHLLGIFVHPAPGTQGAPDGLFGHS